MQTILLISSNKQQLDLYIQNLCKEKAIDALDQTIITSEKSLGIEDIRDMQKKLFLKPFKSKQKIIIIKQADTATIATQNALLKVLEEPPANTSIIVTAATDQSFLPTVLSRCTIVYLEKHAELPEELVEQAKQQIQTILSASVGTKLYLAQNLAIKKEEAIISLTHLLYGARVLLLEQLDNPYETQRCIRLIEHLREAYKTLTTTNVNPRFLLEATFLQI